MATRLVNLPGPITLVAAGKLNDHLARLREEHPHLPLPADSGYLLPELNARPDGVAATFEEPKPGGDRSLLLYLSTVTLRLFQTERQGGYMIGGIKPLRIKDHQRLVRGCLLIRPKAWRMVYDIRQIPEGARSFWSPLVDAWDGLNDDRARDRDVPAVTAEQSAFLDMLDQTIDADEEITKRSAFSTPPFAYRDITSTGERRQGTRSVYVFHLVGKTVPEKGAFVEILGEQGIRGQVTRLVGSSVTVRFDQPIAWERLAGVRQGELEVTPSLVVHRKQREAVALLRSRQAHTTTLLPAMVEHQVCPIPPVGHRPAVELDPDQATAFNRGLATPDLLVVIGPPGTGKTRVISEIARAAAIENGEKVLVTSHTNRAVDNVLARLPKGLEAIRVGNETSVTADGRPYLLETRAVELRERVLGESNRAVAGYDRLDAAEQWANELNIRAGALNTAKGEEARARGRLDVARRAVGGPAQVQVDACAAERNRCGADLDRHRRRSARLATLIEWASTRAEWPVLGAIFGLLVTLCEGRRTAGEERIQGLETVWRQARQAFADAVRELDAFTAADPAVRAARDQVDTAVRLRASALSGALAAAREACTAISAVSTPPSVRREGEREAAEDDVARLLQWLYANLPRIRARAGLLAEWHEEVSGAVEHLYPELIQYADVIAATCIGVASRPELSGIDFDLAIVDEAGQIGVANALVPLVRARRGVLVGDHQQLPPFLDSEVDAWGADVGDPRIRDLLSKSALERLVGGLPGDHIVLLTRQRRMPAVIADFISAAFYGGRLETAVERTHRDAVFARPLALVDTARLSPRERSESSGRARERWGKSGFINEAEADLLVELAVHYHHAGTGWAVIVPYRAQVAKITSALTRRIGNAELVELNVGTVDSFQGGEREVILYGFTRSNDGGRVGFLQELRRANVAFTRAQRQLVLVGDTATLTTARDRGFRELAQALCAHVARDGDIRQYREVHDRITRLNEGEIQA